MKLISLNIWGGTAYEGFMAFVKEHAPTTDIFCFQEVYRSDAGVALSQNTHINIFADIAKALPEFQGFFQTMEYNMDERGSIDISNELGLALFVRSPLIPSKEGFVPINQTPGTWDRKDFATLPHILQYAHFDTATPFTIGHLHGVSRPGTKLDTKERIEQSRKIVAFLKTQPGPKILCGDFNLMPETGSIAMIERAGMRNLIKDFGIKDTRGKLNHDRRPSPPQYFADYAFVSPEIKVKRFEVPAVLASDHLPMILEFSL